MCIISATLVRYFPGFGAVVVRCLCYFSAVFAWLWRGVCATSVLYLPGFGAVFVLLW